MLMNVAIKLYHLAAAAFFFSVTLKLFHHQFNILSARKMMAEAQEVMEVIDLSNQNLYDFMNPIINTLNLYQTQNDIQYAKSNLIPLVKHYIHLYSTINKQCQS